MTLLKKLGILATGILAYAQIQAQSVDEMYAFFKGDQTQTQTTQVEKTPSLEDSRTTYQPKKPVSTSQTTKSSSQEQKNTPSSNTTIDETVQESPQIVLPETTHLQANEDLTQDARFLPDDYLKGLDKVLAEIGDALHRGNTRGLDKFLKKNGYQKGYTADGDMYLLKDDIHCLVKPFEETGYALAVLDKSKPRGELTLNNAYKLLSELQTSEADLARQDDGNYVIFGNELVELIALKDHKARTGFVDSVRNQIYSDSCNLEEGEFDYNNDGVIDGNLELITSVQGKPQAAIINFAYFDGNNWVKGKNPDTYDDFISQVTSQRDTKFATKTDELRDYNSDGVADAQVFTLLDKYKKTRDVTQDFNFDEIVDRVEFYK